ncbi:hypothetical protein ACJ2CR_09480 [Myxococcus faecalis]
MLDLLLEVMTSGLALASDTGDEEAFDDRLRAMLLDGSRCGRRRLG